MMLVVLYVVLHLFLDHLASSSWTQQYRDPASTNYVPITSDSHIQTGWCYSGNGIYSSPAVSEQGVVFIPYLKYPEYSLQVRAVSPDGKEIWRADWIGGDDACSSVSLTNALYDSNHDMVVVGWFCVAAQKYKRTGQLIALNAANGSLIRNGSRLDPGNDMSSLSMNSDAIFLSMDYGCHRNFPLNTYMQSSKLSQTQNNTNEQEDNGYNSYVIVMDLATGKILCKILTNHSGCTAQTKLVSLKDGSSLVVFPNYLPSGHYHTGDLWSLKFSSYSAPCNIDQPKKLKISYGAKFAFSDKGFLFGSYGFAGNSDLIFAMDIENNKVLFSNRGYCDSNDYPSGPAVDKQGYAYYSCGNKVFAVDSKGKLLWNSRSFGEDGYRSDTLLKLSPSIHLDKNVIVFVDTGSTHIYALSSKDGSLQGSSSIIELPGNRCIEPPILVGDAVYLVMAGGEDSFPFNYLYSIPLMF